MPNLTRAEQEIVDLVDEGLTRWAIAERLDLNENTVRQYIRNLCQRYNCPMRDLPAAVKEADDGSR
jgi:DNA-binding CsgD family transcriptional regulator